LRHQQRHSGLLLTSPLIRRLLAESLGSFFLVLIGPGAVMVDAWSGGRLTPVGIALAFAFVITGAVAALAPISGAHINPAVSVAMAWRGRLAVRDLAPYVGAQLVGAAGASAVLAYLLGSVGRSGATLPVIGMPRTLVLELVMSLALGVVVFRARGALAPLAIGVTVGFCALVGGPLTGASMNPARSFGPALVGGEWAGHWIYWAAPIVGMLLAAQLDRWWEDAEMGPNGGTER
jgi:MIP family channel proteins